MINTLPPLYCPNLKCRKSNTEHNQFCQQCGTPIPKRYLWAVGPNTEGFKPGATLGERYVFRGPHVVLDTQPGYPLVIKADVPETLLPYLKLFPYRLHLPQLYTLYFPEASPEQPIALLEQCPLSPTDLFAEPGAEAANPPVPIGAAQSFSTAWTQTHVLRQINWLWQMAQLWQPLASEGVVSTLLDPNLIRVEERLVRLLELKPDRGVWLTLADLGQLWEQWIPETPGPFTDAFAKICGELTSGSITDPDVLRVQLERLLHHYQDAYKVRIDISARTDTGPLRDHNEDACYPNHGAVVQNSEERLAIVCDGVGGHDGGEVASGIAIDVMQGHLTALQQNQVAPEDVVEAMETATFKANDQISAQNDAEQRHDRQRIGTTLDTALVHGDQLYISHIGDSRAYLITHAGCYQVTVDDDIASREVRLGYVPYREALQQPAAGSLIQALGMASSSVLRPTVQRFILDEDCVLLLCSDGLSDYDRVENLWQSEIKPLLYKDTDLVTVTKQLIEQANRLNGHDNVTVAILNCRVTRQRVKTKGAQAAKSPHEAVLAAAAPATLQPDDEADEPHPPVTASDSKPPLPWRSLAVAGGLLLLALGSLAVIFLTRKPVPQPSTPAVAPSPTSSAQPTVSAPETDAPVSSPEGTTDSLPGLESAAEATSAPGQPQGSDQDPQGALDQALPATTPKPATPTESPATPEG